MSGVDRQDRGRQVGMQRWKNRQTDRQEEMVEREGGLERRKDEIRRDAGEDAMERGRLVE